MSLLRRGWPIRNHSICLEEIRQFTANSENRSGLRVREITEFDFEPVAKLLGQGIGYSNQYFLRLLRRMAEHQTRLDFRNMAAFWRTTVLLSEP